MNHKKELLNPNLAAYGQSQGGKPVDSVLARVGPGGESTKNLTKQPYITIIIVIVLLLLLLLLLLLILLLLLL